MNPLDRKMKLVPRACRARISRRQMLAATVATGLMPIGRLSAQIGIDADVAWLDEVQKAPASASLPSSIRLQPLLVDDQGDAIETLEQWQDRRTGIEQWWRDYLGSMSVPRTPVPEYQVLQQDRVGDVVRQRIRYEMPPGEEVEAYLLAPAGRGPRRAGVVVMHSTVPHSIRQPAGLEGRPALALGLQLAQRGCVTICPRNFLWPANDRIDAQPQVARFQQRFPQCRGMARMLFDAQVAVDLLAAHPDVDPQRLGCFGHSLGAKEALYLAAFDSRIRATVSSEGGIGLPYSNWDAPWYLGPAIKRPEFDHEHHELLGLIAPRPFLLIGGDSADGSRSWPFIEAALPVYRLYDQPARLGLLNHRQGHSFPELARQRTLQWLETYLA